jgi:hypothetical protein
MICRAQFVARSARIDLPKRLVIFYTSTYAKETGSKSGKGLTRDEKLRFLGPASTVLPLHASPFSETAFEYRTTAASQHLLRRRVQNVVPKTREFSASFLENQLRASK